MKLARFSAAMVVLGLVAAPAAAQFAGQPVYAIPKGVGLGINLDFGLQVDPSVTGGSNNLALRASLGLPMIKFTAGLQPAMLDNETASGGENRIMAGAAFQLMPMPVSIRLQANAGYGMDSKDIRVVPGVVVALNVPSPMLSIEPWVMPSLRYTKFDLGGSQTNPGVSAGVNLGLPGGLGGHVSLDLESVGSVLPGGSRTNVITAGIGVHYMISLPGLGIPMM